MAHELGPAPRGAGAFLYDRYVRCSPKVASNLNWALTSEIVDREDLDADPGRAFLVGFVGVADGPMGSADQDLPVGLLSAVFARWVSLGTGNDPP